MRRIEGAFLYLGEEIFLWLTSEGESPGEHDIQEYTKGPHIHGFAIVILPPDNLRTHVARRPAKNLKAGSRSSYHYTKAEVNELYHLCVVFNQNVVQFNVTMHDIVLM